MKLGLHQATLAGLGATTRPMTWESASTRPLLNAAEPAHQSDHRGIPTRNPTTNDDLGRAVQNEALEISGAQQLLFNRGRRQSGTSVCGLPSDIGGR